MKEYLNREHISCLCTYHTICTTLVPVLNATNEEEAIKQAKEMFKKWNDKWVKDFGGNPKKLIKVEVIEK